MHLEGYGQSGCEFTAGEAIPNNKTISASKKFFSTGSSYCSLRYEIWIN